MEKIIDAVLGLIEITVVTGLIGFGGAKAISYANDKLKKQAVEALKRPTPPLSDFSRKLTQSR